MVKKRRTKKCPATGKIGYPSEVDAMIKAKRTGEFHDVEMRVYRCPHCRLFHTSRKKQR